MSNKYKLENMQPTPKAERQSQKGPEILSTPEEIKAEIMRRMSDPDLDARCQRWRLGVPWRPLPKLSGGGKGQSRVER